MPSCWTTPAGPFPAGSRGAGSRSFAATACAGSARAAKAPPAGSRRSGRARPCSRGSTCAARRNPSPRTSRSSSSSSHPCPRADFGLCDRYLAAAEWAGLKACIVANKSDLADPSGALAATLEEYVRIGYPVVRASKRAADGIAELTARLAGETSVLVGQSGVGKSSLINRLVPGVEARVEEVSRATEPAGTRPARPRSTGFRPAAN